MPDACRSPLALEPARRNKLPDRGRGAETPHARLPFLLAAHLHAPPPQNVSQSSSDLLLDAATAGAAAMLAAGFAVAAGCALRAGADVFRTGAEAVETAAARFAAGAAAVACDAADCAVADATFAASDVPPAAGADGRGSCGALAAVRGAACTAFAARFGTGAAPGLRAGFAVDFAAG